MRIAKIQKNDRKIRKRGDTKLSNARVTKGDKTSSLQLFISKTKLNLKKKKLSTLEYNNSIAKSKG